MGYDGSMTILKDYVQPFRPAKTSPAVRRYETLPGKQAQMDWGMCPYTDARGVLHRAPTLVMILGSSRAKYVEFTTRCDLRSMLGHKHHLRRKVCKLGIPDNLSGHPMVHYGFHIVRQDNIRHTTKVFKGIHHAAFHGKVRCPQTKGRVERFVRYVKDNFFPGRQFEDLEDLSRQVLQWCREVDSHIHSTTGRIPLQELAKEPLLPLPEQSVRDRYHWEERKVTREGLVRSDGIRYSVPWQYSGKEVQVRLHNGYGEIYKGEVLLAKHEARHSGARILWLKGQYQGLSEHHGVPGPYPAAQMIAPKVEHRDLRFYDCLLGGASNG